tara:strand:- start:151 stop:651 length:501 start_codon:yes stop_codon:yes gene_type:complete
MIFLYQAMDELKEKLIRYIGIHIKHVLIYDADDEIFLKIKRLFPKKKISHIRKLDIRRNKVNEDGNLVIYSMYPNNNINLKDALEAISKLILTYSGDIIVIRADKLKTDLENICHKSMIALGFKYNDYVKDANIFYYVYAFNINDYKNKPDWLNSENWANPELWEK